MGGIITPVSIFEERRDERGRWISAKKLPKTCPKRWKAEYLYTDNYGKRKKVRRIASTKAAVSLAIDQVKKDVEKGLVPGGANKSLDMYLSDWLENTVKMKCTLKTYEKYKSGLNCYVIPFLGKKTQKAYYRKM